VSDEGRESGRGGAVGGDTAGGQERAAHDAHLYAVIMAGGGGTRFWPLSRMQRPKQFLAVAGERSLLQTTWDRALDVVAGPDHVLVVTASSYEDLTREQLPDLPDVNLLLEPQARNTAPCIAWATAEVKRRDPDAVEVVMPADHLIRDGVAFAAAVSTAVAAAREHGVLTTFGVPPRYPETGYGYIEASDALAVTGGAAAAEVFRVAQFREKPDLETAERYVAAGNYFWNSGIFVWTAADVWRAFEQHLAEACAPAQEMLTTGDHDARAEIYARMPATSIDFGIMEHAADVATVKAGFDWSDVGSWAALHEVTDDNEGDNVAFGKVVHVDAGGNLVHAPDAVVTLLGVNNLAVVHTGDVILVASLERSQDVKLLRERLAELGLEHLL
jgi:mannose-1-phosphate guanylyltransferase